METYNENTKEHPKQSSDDTESLELLDNESKDGVKEIATQEAIDPNTTIKKLVRTMKYQVDKEKVFYSSDYTTKLKIFIDSYRVIEYIINSTKITECPDNVKEFYTQLKEQYFEGSFMNEELNSNIEYGLDDLKTQLVLFLKANRTKITELIDYIHSLSKVEKMYDPDETSVFY